MHCRFCMIVSFTVVCLRVLSGVEYYFCCICLPYWQILFRLTVTLYSEILIFVCDATSLAWAILCIRMLYMWWSSDDSYRQLQSACQHSFLNVSAEEQSWLRWFNKRKEKRSSLCKCLILSFHHHNHHFTQVFFFGLSYFSFDFWLRSAYFSAWAV